MSVPIVGPDLRVWANQLSLYLKRTVTLLRYKDVTMTPAVDGSLVWNGEAGYPEVSKGGLWHEVMLADGFARLLIAGDVTAAAVDTAYALTWDALPDLGNGIEVVSDTITFTDGGRYALSVSAQLQSSITGAVNFWIWAEVNGTADATSVVKASLQASGSTTVVSRTVQIATAPGDDVRIRWAVSDTSGILSSEPSTAFAPATPAVVLSIARVAA